MRTPILSRLVLVPLVGPTLVDPMPTAAPPAPEPVRRYRLARMRLDGRASSGRHDHLRRIYD